MDFSINLNENEQIAIIDQAALLLWNNKKRKVCIVVTNFRFIIYFDINKEDSQSEMLRISRAISYLPKYEVLLELNKEEIIKIEKETEFDKYILKNNNYFYLNSEKIYNHINQKK